MLTLFRLLQPSRCLAGILLVGLAAAGLAAGRPGAAAVGRASKPAPASPGGARLSLTRLPLYFVENRGQVDDRAAYYVKGFNTGILFENDGMTLALRSGKSGRVGGRENGGTASSSTPPLSHSPAPSYTIRLQFVGAREDARPVGEGRTPAVVSYFRGKADQWRTGLKTYSSLVYRDLWPGIDLEYAGTVNRLKYQFVVHPGADPNRIRLAYQGVDRLRLDDQGRLEVRTPAGALHDDRPYCYQETNGRHISVPAKYSLNRSEAPTPNAQRPTPNAHQYGFRVGRYDRSKTLVLDPAIFVYAGFVGSFGADQDSGYDEGDGVAVDPAGNAYLLGTTFADLVGIPAVGWDRTYESEDKGDAFVVKVNAAGTALLYAGYIGGTDTEQAGGIAVDAQGNAYVTGTTFSDSSTFPVTAGPETTYGGQGDAFLAKINPSGTALLYAGYLGASDPDEGHGIAVDGNGNAYVTGTTFSPGFVVSPAPNPGYSGEGDAFVTKVNPAGTTVLYSGYIGGADFDMGKSIAVDGGGSAFVVGTTFSSQITPGSTSPDSSYGGEGDAFIARVNAAGTAFLYTGYIGGSGYDEGNGVGVDRDGNGFAAGTTFSAQNSFPVTIGPDLTFGGDQGDAFVAKINAGGTGFLYAGYLGGADPDTGTGLAVDPDGNAYVVGYTGGLTNRQANFPVKGGPDLSYNGSFDTYLAKIAPAGTSVVYAGFIGGGSEDYGLGVAVDANRDVYVAGWTRSGQTSFPNGNGMAGLPSPDPTYNGGYSDAFLVKVHETPQPPCSGKILVTRQTIQFQPTPVGSRRTALLQLRNASRTEPLSVSIAITNSAFGITAASPDFDIGPGRLVNVVVTFTPQINRRVTGIIRISSSDCSRALSNVSVSGIGR